MSPNALGDITSMASGTQAGLSPKSLRCCYAIVATSDHEPRKTANHPDRGPGLESSARDQRAQRPQSGHEPHGPHEETPAHGRSRLGLLGAGRRGLHHRQKVADEQRPAEREDQPGEQVFSKKHLSSVALGARTSTRTRGDPQPSRPLRAALSKRVYGPKKTSFRVPIGPERCLATMTSAIPLSDVSG